MKRGDGMKQKEVVLETLSHFAQKELSGTMTCKRNHVISTWSSQLVVELSAPEASPNTSINDAATR
jgi:hypothetical protein